MTVQINTAGRTNTAGKTKTAGQIVSKEDAFAWIEKYEKELRHDKSADTKSIFFGKEILLELLSGDSAGITFFFGLKHSDFANKEVVNLVLVGTTEDGDLLWDKPADFGTPCPPYCAKY